MTLNDDDNSLSVLVNKLSDINNDHLISIFPNIVEKTTHEEKGVELFMKISEDINKESFEKSKRIEKIFSMKEPIISYVFMAVSIFLFFFLVLFEGNNILEIGVTSLVEFGGNVGILTKNGEYYRLFSSIFLHAGLIHLGCNMYSLYVVGPQVESFYGKIKYFFIFLFSGLTGGILSLAFSPNNVVSVGASGAIFGILGSIGYFGYHYRVYLGNVLKSQIIPIIVLNLMIGFSVSGIDNFGHIGGLIGGIFASMAVGVPDKSSKGDKASGCVLLFIYLSFIVYLAFFK